MRPILALLAAILLLPMLAVCDRQPPSQPGQAPSSKPSDIQTRAIRAIVSIPPLKGLVEPLLPAGSTIDVLIPPGVSEHGYEIPPSKMAALAKADLVVCVGLGLEPQVEQFLLANPSASRRVLWFARVASVPGAEEHDHDHPHDHDHDHGHASPVDPHLWLDPQLAHELVAAVAHSLATPPALLEAQTVRIREIETRYRDVLSKAPRRTILVAHDAYGWLAKRYNLEVVAISGLAATEPTPAAMAEAMRVAKAKGLKVLFVEPQLSPAAGKRTAEATGLKVLTLDPLGDGHWFRMMEQNLEALKAALYDDPAKADGPLPEAPPGPKSPSAAPGSQVPPAPPPAPN